MITADIQKIVQERRKELGLTQAELARRAHLSREMIVRFEGGVHDIGLRKLLRILGSLDLAISVRPSAEPPVLEELDRIFAED